MKIKVQDRVTGSDLISERGVVFVVGELEIVRGVPTRSRIAGAALPSAVVSVDFHHGWGSWVLQTDPYESRTHFVRHRLAEAIEAFEAMVGVELPSIRIVEYGVGVYAARSKGAGENPWALKDGETVEVTHTVYGPRRYKVIKKHVTCVVPYDRAGFLMSDVEFAPETVWTIEEWKSLRRVDGVVPTLTAQTAREHAPMHQQ